MTNATNLTPRQLMEIHIHTLFGVDAQGRLRHINEIGEPPAPLFYMGRTHQGNTWRFRHDLPTTAVAELERLCQSEPIATDLAGVPQNYTAIRAVLREYATGQGQDEYRGPAYWIPGSVETPANVDTEIISRSNIELCQMTFPWLHPLLQDKDIGPVAAAIAQDKAVSLCFCSRRPARATEAGVETLADFRGQGYATAAVAAWSAAVSRLGCIPLYSTSWDNLASQAIARKLQMVVYGADWSIR